MDSNYADILVVSTTKKQRIKTSFQDENISGSINAICNALKMATGYLSQTVYSNKGEDGNQFTQNSDQSNHQILGYSFRNGVAFRNFPIHKLVNESFRIWRFNEFNWEQVSLIKFFQEKIIFIVFPWHIEVKQYSRLIEMTQKLKIGTLFFDKQVQPYLFTFLNANS